MKKIQTRRRAMASLLMLVMVVSLVSPLALAADTGPQPRYTAVSGMTCDFDIGYLGLSSASGTVTLRSGYTAKLTVHIMQSDDGSSWISYKSWSTEGSSYLNISEYYAVERGHFYKAIADVMVYDSNHNVVECVMLESPYKYY